MTSSAVGTWPASSRRGPDRVAGRRGRRGGGRRDHRQQRRDRGRRTGAGRQDEHGASRTSPKSHGADILPRDGQAEEGQDRGREPGGGVGGQDGDGRRPDLEGGRQGPGGLAVGVDGQGPVGVQLDPGGAVDGHRRVLDVAAGEHLGEGPQELELADVADDHHLEQAVGQAGLGGDQHAAAVAGAVGHRHQPARQLGGLAVQGQPELGGAADDQLGQHGPDIAGAVAGPAEALVGDPVDLGVEAGPGDVQVGPPGHAGQVGRPPPQPGQQPGRGQRVARRQPEAAGGVVPPTGRDHPQRGLGPRPGVGQAGGAGADGAVAADGHDRVDRGGGLAGGQAGVLQRPGLVPVDLDPVGGQPGRHLGHEPSGPPTTRGRVVDQQDAHLPG